MIIVVMVRDLPDQPREWADRYANDDREHAQTKKRRRKFNKARFVSHCRAASSIAP